MYNSMNQKAPVMREKKLVLVSLFVPGPSGMSMSSSTPGRDLEYRWSLDMVPDVRSLGNFHRNFGWMVPPI